MTRNQFNADRAILIDGIQWRYERHARLSRLGLPQVDDIAALDAYVQALTDIPQQAGFPDVIDWPVL